MGMFMNIVFLFCISWRRKFEFTCKAYSIKNIFYFLSIRTNSPFLCYCYCGFFFITYGFQLCSEPIVPWTLRHLFSNLYFYLCVHHQFKCLKCRMLVHFLFLKFMCKESHLFRLKIITRDYIHRLQLDLHLMRFFYGFLSVRHLFSTIWISVHSMCWNPCYDYSSENIII